MTRPFGAGDDDEVCLWYSGEGFWCHLNLLLPLNWEHHLCDPDCLVGESSPGHLAASLTHGPPKGDQVYEWPQEYLLPLEALVKHHVPRVP